MSIYNISVPADYSKNERLDKYVASLPNGMNRSKLKSGLNDIFVNGKEQKISYKVKAGDLIVIKWEDNVPEDIEPENIPLDIVYEDENVTVVNKKQGMVTHPAAGNWSGTLVNALLYHWGMESIPEIKEGEGTAGEILKNRRPGIVHRLDKDTSGIIITAKNRDSEEWLHNQFLNHRSLTKEYICICNGRPQHQHGKIETNIVRDPKNRKRFKATLNENEGKHAVSFYECICCYGEYSLMKVRIATGRTHQIRVHMKYLNCPILGDPIYNKVDKTFSSATLMLHARLLKIRLPSQKEQTAFKAKTPPRFLKVLHTLQKQYQKTILDRNR